MKPTLKQRGAALLTALLFPVLALAGRSELPAPAAADLAAAALSGETAMPLLNDERKPLQAAWALPPEQALKAPEPALAESRGYWREASGAELNRGLSLGTSAPGALLRINALAAPGESASPEALQLDPASLELSAGGIRHQGAEAFALAVRGETAGGELLTADATALRINPARGQGQFVLRSRAALPAARRYLVQVQEPDSRLVLSARTGADAYLLGQRLQLAARLTQDGKPLAATRAEGRLVAPDGRRFPLSLRRDAAGDWRAELPLAMSAAQAPGLWELEVQTAGLVPRRLRSAVAIASPTARLGRQLAMSQGEGAWTLAVPVVAALPGRYELTALVYGTDDRGQWRPAAVAASAAWLEGSGELVLKLENSVLNENGLRPPYALRELRLTDQSRLGLVQRQRLELELAD